MQSIIIMAGVLAFSTPVPEGSNASSDEAHWPRWRGPQGTGVTPGEAPMRWSADTGVRWRVDVPGRGFSTPIVWGDRLVLTTAVPLDDAPATDDGAGHGTQSLQVHCLDRRTGATLWKRVADEVLPHEGYHRSYGSFASGSPLTDGDRLFVTFGSFGIFCYDLDGALQWTTDPRVRMQMRRAFGEGSAPALHDGVLVHTFDQEGDSFIAAFDAATGVERWRRDRDEPSTWATPLITEVDGRAQVVASGTNRVRGYDLKTGALVWECGGLGLNAIPHPVRIDDLVIVMSGYRDANIMAIRLGGEGDLTGGERVVWSNPRGAGYTCSPVLVGDLLYSVTDRGALSCFDARTGRVHYHEQRLPRGTQLKASPVATTDRLYIATESGDVHVVKVGTEYELLATNTLPGASFIASPVIADGALYLRSRDALYCIDDEDSPRRPGEGQKGIHHGGTEDTVGRAPDSR